MTGLRNTLIVCVYIAMAVVICVQIVIKVRGDRLPTPPITEPEEPAMASTARATCDQPIGDLRCGEDAYPAEVTCRNGHFRRHLLCAFHALYISMECVCPDCHQYYRQDNPVTVTPQEES